MPLQAAIIDAVLPDCRGIDVVNELRKRSPEMLIIFCMDGDAQELDKLSTNRYVVVTEKPVPASTLVGLITERLKSSHAIVEPGHRFWIPCRRRVSCQ